jgi:hypothetical protein
MFGNYFDKDAEEITLIEGLSDLELVEYFQDFLIRVATNNEWNNEIYKYLRRKILKKSFKDKLPYFVLEYRDLPQFWEFIKEEFPTYKERKEFIWKSFQKLLTFLEQIELHWIVEEEIQFSEPYIHQIWEKALKRKNEDPEGAITIARSLLESVIKTILDEEKVSYNETDSLTALYKKVAKILNLAPENHSEEIFKQILGGMGAVVHGLASLRNRLGDAHGHGKKRIRPKERHSELAVNLAGTMALFLFKSYQEKISKKE